MSNGVPTGNGVVTIDYSAQVAPTGSGPQSGIVQIPVGVEPVRLLFDWSSGRAYVLSYDRIDAPGGWKSHMLVSTIDARAGTLLQQVPVVVAPGTGEPDFALDQQSGHVYVTGQGLTPATSGSANQLIALSPVTGTLMHTVSLPGAPSA